MLHLWENGASKWNVETHITFAILFHLMACVQKNKKKKTPSRIFEFKKHSSLLHTHGWEVVHITGKGVGIYISSNAAVLLPFASHVKRPIRASIICTIYIRLYIVHSNCLFTIVVAASQLHVLHQNEKYLIY